MLTTMRSPFSTRARSILLLFITLIFFGHAACGDDGDEPHGDNDAIDDDTDDDDSDGVNDDDTSPNDDDDDDNEPEPCGPVGETIAPLVVRGDGPVLISTFSGGVAGDIWIDSAPMANGHMAMVTTRGRSVVFYEISPTGIVRQEYVAHFGASPAVATSGDKTYVAYFDMREAEVKLAASSEDGWAVENVSELPSYRNAVDTGPKFDLAVDSVGRAFIVFYGDVGDGFSLLCATNKSGSWEVLQVEPVEISRSYEGTTYPLVKIDGEGTVHMAYFYALGPSWGSQGTVHYTSDFGETIHTPFETVWRQAFAMNVDSHANAYLVVQEESSILTLAEFDGDSWTYGQVLDDIPIGDTSFLSLAVADNDEMALALSDGKTDSLRTWRRVEGDWQEGPGLANSSEPRTAAVGYFPSSRTLFSALYRGILATPEVYLHDAGEDDWEFVGRIDAPEDFPIDFQGFDLAVAADGALKVVYNNSFGEIRQVTKNEDGWRRDILSRSDEDAQYPEMTVDEDGCAQVFYQDGESFDLVYAFEREGAWNWETIPWPLFSSPDIRKFTYSAKAIELIDGEPFIVAGGLSGPAGPSGATITAQRRDGEWAAQEILTDLRFRVGAQLAATIDDASEPHVALFGMQFNLAQYYSFLYHLRRSDGVWTSEILEINEDDGILDGAAVSVVAGNDLIYLVFNRGEELLISWAAAPFAEWDEFIAPVPGSSINTQVAAIDGNRLLIAHNQCAGCIHPDQNKIVAGIFDPVELAWTSKVIDSGARFDAKFDALKMAVDTVGETVHLVYPGHDALWHAEFPLTYLE
ncbi:MAG: hypothetical protein H6685_13155 [Deltaproteobacteria bacterium]|nr:hypothetical protein [Deltaproteobacteria bacterium]